MVDCFDFYMWFVVFYYFGWFDECGCLVNNNCGKVICFVLVFVVVEVVGVDFYLVIFGVVLVELVYNFLFVYDDFMDCDEYCWYWLMVWVLWGDVMVLLVGDVMLLLVYEVLLDCDLLYVGVVLCVILEVICELICG